MKNRNGVIALTMSMFLLLGLTLGTSITMFILFLNKSDHLLAIISYLCLGIFVVLVIVQMYLLNKYRIVIFNRNQSEENNNEEENQ